MYRTLKSTAIRRYYATLLYIGSVVLINTLFLWIPLITVAGTTMTPADITAGSVYIFRDFAQREIKHHVIFAMIIASLISYALANGTIALASFTAFGTAELIDWGIFTLTKKPLSQRLLSSALVSAPIDSLIFCKMAHCFTGLDLVIMTLAKFAGVFIIWYVWKFRRMRTAKASYAA